MRKLLQSYNKYYGGQNFSHKIDQLIYKERKKRKQETDDQIIKGRKTSNRKNKSNPLNT